MDIKYEDFGVVKSCRATTLPSKLWFTYKVARNRQKECQAWENENPYKVIALEHSARAIEELVSKLLSVDNDFIEFAKSQSITNIVEIAKVYTSNKEG